MKSLYVYIERKGIMTFVGTIFGTNSSDASFVYSSEYLNSANAKAISISLPLQNHAFSPEKTKSYFESLLPEGFTRKAVADAVKANDADYISLLECLGRECIGAIQILSEKFEEESGYREISEDELLELAKEGTSKSTALLIESHISLAGASGKVGLYYDAASDKWYKPYGIAASSHIVKQSHVRLDHLVLNEQLSMLTASKLKIDVPQSRIMKMGKEEEVLYVIKRYDRIIRDEKCVSPFRLHQEDFAQALGIHSSEKYEIEDRQYLKRMFSLINDYSSNPIEDGLKLWDRVVFNFLLGNTDSHIKNYGLLYSTDLDSIRLAPAYDMVCTRIYGTRNDMSVMINGKLDCTLVNRDDFSEVTRDLLIGKKVALEHYDYLCENFENALRESIEEMKSQGFKEAVQLGNKILKASMINS